MLSSNKKTIKVTFANTELILDSLGALYWPLKETLVLADLHLEKGSYYAVRGNPIPTYDTLDTLKRLEQLIEHYKPKILISLGDNIHDTQAFFRINQENNNLLYSLVKTVPEWIWIMGNHDAFTTPETHLNARFYEDYNMEPITFSHDFNKKHPFQIIGHYHPKASVKSIKGKCFLLNDQTLIMPSFGTYTGGLTVQSPTLKKIMGEKAQVYLLYKENIWRTL